MTNEERQQAIEWLKRRPVMMAGAKRMYDLAVEALEAYVPDMNVGETEPSRESDTEITRCSDDTISRQAAIDALERAKQNIRHNMERAIGNAICEILDEVENGIKQLPSAQPEIIRCKDCQYWNKGSCECPEHAVNCQDYYVGDIETEAEYFCGYAERREVTT